MSFSLSCSPAHTAAEDVSDEIVLANTFLNSLSNPLPAPEAPSRGRDREAKATLRKPRLTWIDDPRRRVAAGKAKVPLALLFTCCCVLSMMHNHLLVEACLLCALSRARRSCGFYFNFTCWRRPNCCVVRLCRWTFLLVRSLAVPHLNGRPRTAITQRR